MFVRDKTSGRNKRLATQEEALKRTIASDALTAVEEAGYGTASGERVLRAPKGDLIHANAGMVQHAELEHWVEIRAAGYDSVLSMVVDVLANYTEIVLSDEDALLLIRRAEEKGKSPVVVVGVVKDADGACRAKSARIMGHKQLNRKSSLPMGSPPLPQNQPLSTDPASLSAAPDDTGEATVLVGNRRERAVREKYSTL